MASIYKETTAGEIKRALEATPPRLRETQKVLVPEQALPGDLVRIPKQQRINMQTGRWEDE